MLSFVGVLIAFVISKSLSGSGVIIYDKKYGMLWAGVVEQSNYRITFFFKMTIFIFKSVFYITKN